MESEEIAPPHRRPRRPSSAPAGPGAAAADPPAHNGGTDSVKVFVRIRPSGVAGLLAAGVPEEGGTPLQQVGGDALRVSGGGGPEAKVFALHGVLGPQCTQAEVYEDVGPLVLDSVRHGYNASVLAYGQTGSGKTHTMLGRTASTAGLAGGVGENAGVIPRSCDELFRWLAGQAGQASVQCSVVEIYMEKITDLLHPGGNSLALLGDGGVKGLTWHTTKSAGDVLRLLDRATASRQTAATRMNAASSRSHMVLQCRVELRVALAADAANGNGVRPTRRGSVAVRVRRSLLSFVDLAGSERQKMAGTEGERLAEGAAINKSLLALSKVIYTLAAAPSVGSSTAPYVPYRDSVLTRLLQPSLGGNSRTVLLATVSPDRSCLAETLSTLDFAQRAKYVVNKVVAHDEVVEQRPDHGSLAPGSASAAHLAVTAAELAERDARIAALLRQLDRVAAEAAEQRQDAERLAEALAEQAAATTEAALEAARQQAQALAAASLERQATGVREATVAQLVEQEWELQEAQGELEAARRELEGARSEAEAARGQLYATRDELEQAWQTQRMLAENLTQALASNAKLEASLQEERVALGKAMEALRGQAARPTIVSAPQGQMLSDESRRAELQHGTIERLQAADREAADELQARLADSEKQEREQALRLQAHEQECAALRAQLANWEAQHQQAVRSWEADASSWQQEQAKLNVRVAAAEAREQEQVGALRAARRQLECLQAQLDRQIGELEWERGGWLTLAGRLQTMVHGPANKQDVIPVDVHCTDGESHNGLEHITASRSIVWQERRNAQLQNLAAIRGWRAATGSTYGGHSLL